MTATCPAGHVSATIDYCDQCGARIGAAGAAVVISEPSAADTSATPVCAPCPCCGTPRTGSDRFCEDCGFDFVAGRDDAQDEDEDDASAAVEQWTIRIAADREYFDRMAPAGLVFPADTRQRSVALDGARLLIGRACATADTPPDIEVGDPAVSRAHASLVPSGAGWAIVDEGSSNGTTVNDADEPIAPHVAVELHDGDRVHVGAWTTITVDVRSRGA